MGVYPGKLEYDPHALDTIITVVVPNNIAKDQPSQLYPQRAISKQGSENENINFRGTFTVEDTMTVEIRDVIILQPADWSVWVCK